MGVSVAVPGRSEKKPPAAKVAPPARAARGSRAVKAAPATPSEATAVVGLEPGAAVVAALTRPSRNRPAAKAAAALRGEPDPETGPLPDPESPESPEPDAADPVETVPIVFCGRTLMVKLPTPEQLTMYRRLSTEFQNLAQDGNADRLTLDQALKHLDRAVRLVQSIMAEARDKEWLEDQMLEGNIELKQCTSLLRDAFILLNRKAEEQAAGQNRETRRARARLAED